MRYRGEYDCYRDGVLVASGKLFEIARAVGLSVVTVMDYRYSPHGGFKLVRREK